MNLLSAPKTLLCESRFSLPGRIDSVKLYGAQEVVKFLTVKMLLVLISSFFATVHGNVVRLPCKVHGNFDVIVNDTAFNGSPVSTLSAASTRQCLLHCASHPSCSCANYNKETLSCELFNTTFHSAVQGLMQRLHWTFFASSTKVNIKNCHSFGLLAVMRSLLRKSIAARSNRFICCTTELTRYSAIFQRLSFAPSCSNHDASQSLTLGS